MSLLELLIAAKNEYVECRKCKRKVTGIFLHRLLNCKICFEPTNIYCTNASNVNVYFESVISLLKYPVSWDPYY